MGTIRLAGLAGVVLASASVAGLLPARSGAASADSFERRVAGSYVVDIALDGALLPIQALATITADGGVVATDTDDFGNTLAFGFHSPKHGVWVRSGHRGMSVAVLEYAFDPTGALTTIFKLEFDAELERGLQTGDGVVTFDAFLPFQDPLDPTETPVASGTGSFSLQRITVGPIGGGGHDEDDD